MKLKKTNYSIESKLIKRILPFNLNYTKYHQLKNSQLKCFWKFHNFFFKNFSLEKKGIMLKRFREKQRLLSTSSTDKHEAKDSVSFLWTM